MHYAERVEVRDGNVHHFEPLLPRGVQEAKSRASNFDL
jgi:hypothetical protein